MESKSNWNQRKRNEIIRWLALSAIDRESAGLEIYINQLGKAVYNLQQSAEKLLKAFLFANDLPVKKTHDIPSLILDAVAADVNIHKLRDVGVGAEDMAKFATCYRYPNSSGIDFAQTKETEGAVEFVDSLYRYLKPFFGDEIVEEALAYGKVPVNPFEEDLAGNIVETLFAIQREKLDVPKC